MPLFGSSPPHAQPSAPTPSPMASRRVSLVPRFFTRMLTRMGRAIGVLTPGEPVSQHPSLSATIVHSPLFSQASPGGGSHQVWVCGSQFGDATDLPPATPIQVLPIQVLIKQATDTLLQFNPALNPPSPPDAGAFTPYTIQRHMVVACAKAKSPSDDLPPPSNDYVLTPSSQSTAPPSPQAMITPYQIGILLATDPEYVPTEVQTAIEYNAHHLPLLIGYLSQPKKGEIPKFVLDLLAPLESQKLPSSSIATSPPIDTNAYHTYWAHCDLSHHDTLAGYLGKDEPDSQDPIRSILNALRDAYGCSFYRHHGQDHHIIATKLQTLGKHYPKSIQAYLTDRFKDTVSSPLTKPSGRRNCFTVPSSITDWLDWALLGAHPTLITISPPTQSTESPSPASPLPPVSPRNLFPSAISSHLLPPLPTPLLPILPASPPHRATQRVSLGDDLLSQAKERASHKGIPDVASWNSIGITIGTPPQYPSEPIEHQAFLALTTRQATVTPPSGNDPVSAPPGSVCIITPPDPITQSDPITLTPFKIGVLMAHPKWATVQHHFTSFLTDLCPAWGEIVAGYFSCPLLSASTIPMIPETITTHLSHVAPDQWVKILRHAHPSQLSRVLPLIPQLIPQHLSSGRLFETVCAQLETDRLKLTDPTLLLAQIESLVRVGQAMAHNFFESKEGQTFLTSNLSLDESGELKQSILWMALCYYLASHQNVSVPETTPSQPSDAIPPDIEPASPQEEALASSPRPDNPTSSTASGAGTRPSSPQTPRATTPAAAQAAAPAASPAAAQAAAPAASPAANPRAAGTAAAPAAAQAASPAAQAASPAEQAASPATPRAANPRATNTAANTATTPRAARPVATPAAAQAAAPAAAPAANTAANTATTPRAARPVATPTWAIGTAVAPPANQPAPPPRAAGTVGAPPFLTSPPDPSPPLTPRHLKDAFTPTGFGMPTQPYVSTTPSKNGNGPDAKSATVTHWIASDMPLPLSPPLALPASPVALPDDPGRQTKNNTLSPLPRFSDRFKTPSPGSSKSTRRPLGNPPMPQGESDAASQASTSPPSPEPPPSPRAITPRPRSARVVRPTSRPSLPPPINANASPGKDTYHAHNYTTLKQIHHQDPVSVTCLSYGDLEIMDIGAAFTQFWNKGNESLTELPYVQVTTTTREKTYTSEWVINNHIPQDGYIKLYARSNEAHTLWVKSDVITPRTHIKSQNPVTHPLNTWMRKVRGLDAEPYVGYTLPI